LKLFKLYAQAKVNKMESFNLPRDNVHWTKLKLDKIICKLDEIEQFEKLDKIEKLTKLEKIENGSKIQIGQN